MAGEPQRRLRPRDDGSGSIEDAMKDSYPPNEGQESERPDDDALQLAKGDIAGVEAAASPQDEIAALNDKILRLAAELENTRRRAEREKLDAGRYGIAAFARDLLGVVDAMDRAFAHAPSEKSLATVDALWTILEGVKLSEANMLQVLERHGVRRIFPRGEKFDPNVHQAVAQAPGDFPAGHVLDVAQPGFVIGDRTLRAAMVVVSTGPAGASGGASETGGTQGAQVDTSA
jgi:molecular chaperone GrpE